ncbi:cyclodeaminase/cyclohydrolase family protein [Clostridium tarantellae]|uniref:Methenyltetrahydrofolate cyclohydrolase n=1 Tax=Clostridium tarantellae TaxID=39493 RepID=A0A6I1MXE1_9CLOT|nr:cyclodeaminase/cyclohydrolase family protein [Clostridium tarantellae]MPQ44819.1 methenyltetrahydrofolate cyclohydrolase [Clostridium tarantellae]
MKNMEIGSFIKELSSNSPAPGGGAASALSGALAVALTSMVYNLTVGKKVYNELDEDKKNKLLINLEECNNLNEKMLLVMNRDKEVFLELMNSYKLSKETDEDKKIRKEVIEKCTKEAMNVPLQLAKVSMKFYENIKFAAKYGNKNLISDAAVACIMLGACIESSIINTEVNLAFIEDKELKGDIRKVLDDLKFMNNKFKTEILEYTNSTINKE